MPWSSGITTVRQPWCFRAVVLSRRAGLPRGASIMFRGGVSHYTLYKMESLINKFSNKYIWFCNLSNIRGAWNKGQLLNGSVAEKRLRTTVLRFWKSELHFPYLKAAARKLLGVTMTSAPSEQVFSHADWIVQQETHQSWHWLQIFAIHMLMRMNPHLGMNWTWIKVVLICM